MKVFNTIIDYQTWLNSHSSKSVGFVPTMGALHAGHSTLLKQARKENELCVLSIFVNPIQFAPNEDLSKYPRTLEADLKIAESVGVDAVFVPTNETLYAADFSTTVSEENLSLPFCGQFRPGHFKGVATVVLKLFNIIRPSVAYFGLKDAQQFLVIERMVRDLNLDSFVRVVGVPTVRESTALALSSRNVYLSENDRLKKAPEFYKILLECQQNIVRENGEMVTNALTAARTQLKDAGFEVQYLELGEIKESPSLGNKRILASAIFIAGKSGSSVRLIDNIIF